MNDTTAPIKPYISADQRIPETTFLSITVGMVLAIIMGAANTYLGLYAGMTVSASIPAAVVSMAILRGIFRRGTILENNIAQTIASTGESLAAGAIFTLPALIMVGAWQDFEFWPTTFIVMLGGVLGVIFMVPLRKALIVDRPDLAYPEGVACAEVLIVGTEGGSGIKWIGLGLAIGAIFKYLVSGLNLILAALEGAVATGRSVFFAGADMSVALLAVGYIVGLSIAAQVFAGGVIAALVALPLIGGFEGGDPLEHAAMIRASHVRFLGVGAMLIGGIYSIWSVRYGILAGIASLRNVAGVQGRSEVPRTEQNMSFTALLTIFLAAAFGTLALYDFLIGSLGVALAATAVMLFAAFLFVAVATYIVGLVGSSNSPVSGMTICALLLTAGVLLALGVKGDSAILATLGVAGVVCCAACTSGDIAQDLKTGQIVGSTPKKQQWTEILSVIIPAFMFAPVMSALHEAYVIGVGLEAPQAALFASLTDGFFGEGQVPWGMVAWGVGIGAAVIAVDFALKRNNSPLRLHVMPVAVGLYLPFSLAVTIFIGGLIRWVAGRARANASSEAQDQGILFGSGLIAGEALMGIALAIPITLEKNIEGFRLLRVPADSWLASWPVSVFLFGTIIATFTLIARRHRA